MTSEQEQSATSRTVTKMEAVEVDLYTCPLCSQDYEKEEMAEIKIDKRKLPIDTKREGRFQGSGQICIYCAESVWGYERAPTSYSWTHTPESEEKEDAPDVTLLGTLAGLLGRGITAVLTVWLFWFIMTNAIEFTNSMIA